MKKTNGTVVLAIGVDAAEPALIRRLIEKGELPALKRLLDGGTWHRVDSPAHIGSSAIWPTFFTGTEPAEHGVYGPFGSKVAWDPETMSLTLLDPERFTPFWETLGRDGATIGVLDVPDARFVGLSEGFEVSGWGSHNPVEEKTRVSPAALLDVVTKATRPHPYSYGHVHVSGPGDYRGLTKLSSNSLEGAQLRGSLAARLIADTAPELAIVVFQEIHHAGHYLWHTVAPEHRLYTGDAFRKARVVSPTLIDIYREVDRQIGHLIEAGGSEATVLVFSLHSMEPGRGVPTILDPLLHDLGLARLTDLGTRSWVERTRSAVAVAKRHTPQSVKKLYRNTAPSLVKERLTSWTQLPAYDWSRTRAFSLPTDQHGWVRLNLLDREAKGIVPQEQYAEVCDLIEDALRGLNTEDGRPLVQDVLRPSRGAEEALVNKLPDLIVHWRTAALESPVVLRLKNRSVEAYPIEQQLTGQHAFDGFCIVRDGPSVAGGDNRIEESLAARDLHRLIVTALGISHGDDASYGTVDT